MTISFFSRRWQHSDIAHAFNGYNIPTCSVKKTWRQSFADAEQLSITRKGPYSLLGCSDSITAETGCEPSDTRDQKPLVRGTFADEMDAIIDTEFSSTPTAPSLVTSPASSQPVDSPMEWERLDSISSASVPTEMIFPDTPPVVPQNTIVKSQVGSRQVFDSKKPPTYPFTPDDPHEILDSSSEFAYSSEPDQVDHLVAGTKNLSEDGHLSGRDDTLITPESISNEASATVSYLCDEHAEPITPGSFCDRRLQLASLSLKDRFVPTLRVNRKSISPTDGTSWQVCESDVGENIYRIKHSSATSTAYVRTGESLVSTNEVGSQDAPRPTRITETSTSPFIKRWVHVTKKSTLPTITADLVTKPPGYLIREIQLSPGARLP